MTLVQTLDGEINAEPFSVVAEVCKDRWTENAVQLLDEAIPEFSNVLDFPKGL